MNGQNQYTVKASGALQEAFKMAAARGNPETTPTHLLLALLQQESGVAPRFLSKVGVPAGPFESELKQALERLPSADGAAEPHPSRSLRTVLFRDEAQQHGRKGDSVTSRVVG